LCGTFLSSPYLGLNQYNYVHTGTETLYSDEIRSSDGAKRTQPLPAWITLTKLSLRRSLEYRLSLTMSVDDFERRRLMRSQRQESEVEFSFFLDRMASTVSPQSSKQLSPPRRRQSEDDTVEAMILNNYMEQDAPSNNHAQPPELPQRRRSVDVSKVIAKKSSADEAPSVSMTYST
jgi:hypothetical protein